MSNEEKVWSVSELASAARVSRQTILEHIDRGTIFAEKDDFSGMYKIPDWSAKSYIDSRKGRK